jgi:hypothetical protein
MADIKSREDYARAIAEEWIKHATESDRLATEPGALFEQGFHAFMANAISTEMLHMSPETQEAYSRVVRAWD